MRISVCACWGSSSTTASLHRQSRGNHLPICRIGDVTMGPLCITDPPEVPCFPCEQLCPHTSSASKVCRGGQGTHRGPAGESLLASTRVYSVCLPFRLATLSFAPGSLLGKGIPHNASTTFWHRQGALVLSDTPQSKASSGNSFRIVCTSAPNLGGKKPALLPGEEPGALLESQACPPPPCLAALPCPALPWLLPPQRLSSLLSLAPSPLSSSGVQPQPSMVPGVPGCWLWPSQGSAGQIMAHLNPLSWPFMLWRQETLGLKSFRQLTPSDSSPTRKVVVSSENLTDVSSQCHQQQRGGAWRGCPRCSKASWHPLSPAPGCCHHV